MAIFAQPRRHGSVDSVLVGYASDLRRYTGNVNEARKAEEAFGMLPREYKPGVLMGLFDALSGIVVLKNRRREPEKVC